MLKKLLIKHEGLRLKPYRCSEGKLTIGIGHNLDANGISENIAYALFDEDVEGVEAELSTVPVYGTLDKTRQEVLINMCFNMGLPSLLKFKKMWAALAERKYNEAAVQMMDSRWALQVGDRSSELAAIMREGRYP